ncbi:RNA polymerase-associated protein CTR9 homolog [Drosophila bipectinata]|uniref:RNA polymerase-associated protein CTR9 homolog n=1 Tax=Drosophila bipectinata TaxID=42026 RepID=UPI001C8A83CA|nr:RNA polymerase-associated protein CTR9 homolog [Drosophila bipectinata]
MAYNQALAFKTEILEPVSKLQIERFPLRHWINHALSFYTSNQYENFVQVLEAAISRCMKSSASYREDLARAYNVLVAGTTRQAYKELGNRRALLMAKLTNLFRVMEGTQRVQERTLMVTKGYAFMLTAMRAAEADALFVNVLWQSSSNVLALIGRGCLAYARQDYLAALGFFKSVLLHQPRGPGDVRVGIAHCFLKMGDVDSARRCFELALAKNGRSQNALLGMALLKLNQCQKDTHIEGIHLLSAAFELNPRHAAVLGLLAKHYYHVGDHEKVWSLAGNAYMLTDIPQLQSENCLLIARSFHATRQFDKAKYFYAQSVKLAPEGYVLSQLGLAQMHLRRGGRKEAKGCLETLLKVLPKEHTALVLLSKIYLAERAAGQVDQAIEMLVRVVGSRLGRCNCDCWLTLAFGYEQKGQWLRAIDAYQKAMGICKKSGREVPVEWVNNLAATQQLAKMPQQALITIDEALARSEESTGEHNQTNLLTLRFNRCRILEDLHRCDLAEIAYKVILDEYPSYYDCFLRLGVMALRQNKFSIATEYFKDVLKVDNNNLPARSYLGNCYLKLGLASQAMYNFKVMEDSYGLVAMGNICLHDLKKCLDNGDRYYAKKHQEKAVQLFKKAIERNPRNMWAANGIGVALSCREFSTEAEACFQQIVEAGKECPSATLNFAHTALTKGQYKQASQTYKQCLEECLSPNCVEIIVPLAKSLYMDGKTREAKIWLLKARHLSPEDPVVMFNLGLAIKKDSERIFQAPRPEIAELVRAELELKVSYSYFDHLSTSLLQTEVSLRAAAKQAKKCESLLANLPDELRRVRQLDDLEETRIRLQTQRYQERQEQLEQQRLREDEEKRKLREEQLAKRLEVLERTKKMFTKAALENSETEKKSSKKRKGRGKKSHRNDLDDEDLDKDRQVPEKKSRKRHKSKGTKSSRKRKEVHSSDSEAANQIKKYKSTEFIETSSEDSDIDFKGNKLPKMKLPKIFPDSNDESDMETEQAVQKNPEDPSHIVNEIDPNPSYDDGPQMDAYSGIVNEMVNPVYDDGTEMELDEELNLVNEKKQHFQPGASVEFLVANEAPVLMDRHTEISESRQLEINFMQDRENGELNSAEAESLDMLNDYFDALEKKMEAQPE